MTQPKIDKTPYTGEIKDAMDFYDEFKESDMAKKGTADYAEGYARNSVLPIHLQNMNLLHAEEQKLQAQISMNLELVQTRTRDLQLSTEQFIDGESAYERLA